MGQLSVTAPQLGERKLVGELASLVLRDAENRMAQEGVNVIRGDVVLGMIRSWIEELRKLGILHVRASSQEFDC